MIRQLRIDERLIHGQITTQWSKVLGIDAIVVANDAVARDELTKKVLLMTVPAGKKVTIRSIKDTIKLLTDPRADKMKVFIIVDNPTDAYVLANELNIKEINVGNFNKKKSDNKIIITENISATKEDFEELKKLSNIDADTFIQILPSSPKYDLKQMLKEKEGK